MNYAKSRYFEARLDALLPMRQYVNNMADAVCKDKDAISELIIAFNEAVTNVILHGYRGQPGVLEIAVGSNTRYLSVRIRDQAHYFDPTTVPAPDVTLPLDKRPFGGMGIHMMREFVDNIHYRAIPSGGNELILEKEIAK